MAVSSRLSENSKGDARRMESDRNMTTTLLARNVPIATGIERESKGSAGAVKPRARTAARRIQRSRMVLRRLDPCAWTCFSVVESSTSESIGMGPCRTAFPLWKGHPKYRVWKFTGKEGRGCQEVDETAR